MLVAAALGLLAFACQARVASVVVGMLRGRSGGEDPLRAPAEWTARAIVAFLAGGTVVLSSLAVLGVLVPRPGEYPGGVLAKGLAVAALLALAALAVRLVSHRRRES